MVVTKIEVRDGKIVGDPEARAAYAIKKAIEHTQNLDRDKIDKWADGAIEYALGEVVRTAKERKMERFLWVAAAGPQGGGKGTQVEALIRTSAMIYGDIQVGLANGKKLDERVSPELFGLIEHWANAGEIVTGTGGIMSKPAGEYALLFAGIEAIAKKYTDVGELVPAKFVGIMVTLLTALRIAQGKTLIVGDLFPRNAEQKEILDKITGVLEGCGVKTDVAIVDFKLMPEEVVGELNKGKSDAVIMDKWAVASIRIGEVLKDFVPKLREEPADAPYNMRALLKTLVGGSLEFKSICGEVQIAMDRVAIRVRKAGDDIRSDDAQLSVLINRLASYLGETWPALLGFSETRFVSAMPKEDAVFGSFVMALLKNPELAKDTYVMNFISRGQKIVKDIVARK